MNSAASRFKWIVGAGVGIEEVIGIEYDTEGDDDETEASTAAVVVADICKESMSDGVVNGGEVVEEMGTAEEVIGADTGAEPPRARVFVGGQ